ncbi:MAG: hypothetical protein HDS81_06195 [Bacteroidales bacterium]|nr:hypothetical protein [Bacteroidales bacterium]
MKRFIFPIVAGAMALSAVTVSAQEQLLAFPGAEGFGRYTTGGRGGEIYHVTNLNDSGTGSLRDAVSKENRIIVFDVSGTITLKSPLVFKGNNTVLGQTAPGEGIQVYGDRVSFSGANNLIVRYIRFRMGVNGTNGADACGVANGTDMIFDHLSVLWGRDENFSVSWDNKNNRPANITIQNSIIGQGLQSHSCGGLIQTIGGVTLYRNLYIENKTRNPKVKGLNQYVNNVVYNWGNGGCYIMSDSEGDSWADIENNYFMRGNWNSATDPFVRGIQSFRYYGAGNYYDDNKDGEINGHEMTVDEMKGAQDGTAPYSTWFASLDALNANITEYNATASEAVQLIPEIAGKMTALEALKWMPENVGPSLPAYDEVDQYIIDELSSWGTVGTKNGITSEKQLPHKGTGVLSGGVKPQDTDGDGIPDAWEIANGLNPNDASDAKAIAANGYANIENYVFTIDAPYPYIKKPVNLTVGEQAKTTISMNWELNKNTACGFIVEQSTDGNTFTEKGRVAAGVTTYTATDLTPNQDYYFRVRSFNNDGIYSDYSDVLKAETIGDPAAPSLSTDPQPENGSKVAVAGGLTLTWTNTTKAHFGTVKYSVYLGTDAANLPLLAENLTATTYKISEDLAAGKTYYWRVDATNDIGTTTGTVWSFSSTAGGVLFYTDFYHQPAAWAAKFENISDNTNVSNSADARSEFDGMVIGCGSDAIRMIAMSGANNSADGTKDYGPATPEDEGASDRCLQFYTTKAGGYVSTPTVTGPCVVTIYAGNPDKSSKTIKLNTIVNGTETTVADLTLGASKRMYKFEYTYTSGGTVQFKIDANGKKVNINDILVERYVAEGGDQALELTAGELNYTDMSYADGSMQLTFNQDIKYNGGAVISGKTQYEGASISASGKKLTINYENLNVNTEYTLSFPSGAITNIAGTQSYVTEVKFNTCDFPALKADGETHYGKAAKELPLNFAPFTTVAPFATVGGLVQDKQNDYPHWVQASGDVTDEAAVLTSTSDKIMCYYGPSSKALYLEATIEGNVKLKVQESRNCDIEPGWRTIRSFSQADSPVHTQLDLNPESHFVKLSTPTNSGKATVTMLRIADDNGSYGSDFTGIENIRATEFGCLVEGNTVYVSGAKAGSIVNVFDIAGRLVATTVTDAAGAAELSLESGVVIFTIDGYAVKVRI